MPHSFIDDDIDDQWFIFAIINDERNEYDTHDNFNCLIRYQITN